MGVQDQRQSEAPQGLACGPSALGPVSSPCALRSSEYRWGTIWFHGRWALLGGERGYCGGGVFTFCFISFLFL